MSNIFQFVKGQKVPRAVFDLSRETKLSMRFGELIPVLCEEVVPGDEFNINTETMIRFAPMLAPLMHRVDAYIHYFYVRSNLVMPTFEQLITGTEALTIPTLESATPVVEGDLLDYFGIPPGIIPNTVDINALPIRCYKQIFNDYYRDQDLQDELDVDDDTDWGIMLRAWEKDYFTSARPWAQKGNPVEFQITSYPSFLTPARGYVSGTIATGAVRTATATNADGSKDIQDFNEQDLELQNISHTLGSIDMNEFRTAHRIQRWLERNARAGSRYVEHLLAHWGVKSDDGRLHRAEYIGGGRTPVVISEVLQTTGSEDANAHPVGELAGHGLALGNTNKAHHYCKEHGYILAIMSVLPKSAYSQGIHRMWSRNSVYDFYNIEFARLGEQEILNREIYAQNDETETGNTGVFGYQSRYAEYKYANSTVHGDFRTTLDYWTLFRKFSSLPTLNDQFIKCDEEADDLNRPFAVVGGDKMWVQLYHNVTAKRPMPFFNDPTL